MPHSGHRLLTGLTCFCSPRVHCGSYMNKEIAEGTSPESVSVGGAGSSGISEWTSLCLLCLFGGMPSPSKGEPLDVGSRWEGNSSEAVVALDLAKRLSNASLGLKLELCTSDRMGLLSDVTRIFREHVLTATRAEEATRDFKAINTFYGLKLELCTSDRVGLLSDITRIFRLTLKFVHCVHSYPAIALALTMFPPDKRRNTKEMNAEALLLLPGTSRWAYLRS
ncbi:hypothetical protein ZIOFF_064499 [Zingiber officinale]|uniref:ACT domain-containing protein ACR n=1 Tax=Zingiber officinale TaxID=94328 RepID=A0A8J5EWQ0_ZINOF|nr:hypothetical protein ZIOFF_064499 [Zingiber officinale]